MKWLSFGSRLPLWFAEQLFGYVYFLILWEFHDTYCAIRSSVLITVVLICLVVPSYLFPFFQDFWWGFFSPKSNAYPSSPHGVLAFNQVLPSVSFCCNNPFETKRHFCLPRVSFLPQSLARQIICVELNIVILCWDILLLFHCRVWCRLSRYFLRVRIFEMRCLPPAGSINNWWGNALWSERGQNWDKSAL